MTHATLVLYAIIVAGIILDIVATGAKGISRSRKIMWFWLPSGPRRFFPAINLTSDGKIAKSKAS
jgi:hypothetical protein